MIYRARGPCWMAQPFPSGSLKEGEGIEHVWIALDGSQPASLLVVSPDLADVHSPLGELGPHGGEVRGRDLEAWREPGSALGAPGPFTIEIEERPNLEALSGRREDPRWASYRRPR